MIKCSSTTPQGSTRTLEETIIPETRALGDGEREEEVRNNRAEPMDLKRTQESGETSWPRRTRRRSPSSSTESISSSEEYAQMQEVQARIRRNRKLLKEIWRRRDQHKIISKIVKQEILSHLAQETTSGGDCKIKIEKEHVGTWGPPSQRTWLRPWEPPGVSTRRLLVYIYVNK